MRGVILIAAFAAGCGSAPQVAPDGRTALTPDERVDCGTFDRLMSGDATTQGEWAAESSGGVCQISTHLGLARCSSVVVTDPYGGGRGCFWSEDLNGPNGPTTVCFWIACK